MAEYRGLDLLRIKELSSDIVTLSKEPKLNKEMYKNFTPEVQKEIKRINANFNQLVKLSLDLVLETKNYSKTTFVWNNEDKEEFDALMDVLGE